nr:hypothetical protein [Desulfobacterales bacterium]
MIDSNAISNLQMLMNISDGRHAVLAELLDTPTASQPPIIGLIVSVKKKRESIDSLKTHMMNPFVRGKTSERIRLRPKVSHKACGQATFS